MNNANLSSRFPPIHSQRGLLSCVAIAFCDAVWWEVERGRVPGVQTGFRPSVQFVYYNARKLNGEQNSNAPVTPSTAMEAINQWGVCDVQWWPNETRLYRERPSDEAYEQAVKFEDWRFEVVPQTLDGIRGCLQSETPFFFCIRFCRSNSWSFEGGKISKTGVLTLPESGETPTRNHAMLAVGLDEEHLLVQARNSYGPEWGAEGHVFIPLDYLLHPELGYALWKLAPPRRR
ncbi:MAG: hypothetical protein KDA85_07420 [Planctomycetaceae bacterium]|nr:hypothetical protein [Planctomycetaceae bacterium]